MTSSKQSKNLSGIIISITCILSYGYAVLRYCFLGPVPFTDLSFYILNKGIALSAFILLSVSLSLTPLQNIGVKMPTALLDTRKSFGKAASILVLIHILMSLILMNPAVYAKFYQPDGTLTFIAGLSMLGGILAFIMLRSYRRRSGSEANEKTILFVSFTPRSFSLTFLFLNGIHLFFMGYKGWLTPESWYGGLPPISLIAFVFSIAALIVNVIGRK